MRLQVSRRKEIIGKKEITIMDWARRNQDDRSKNDREKADLDTERDL